MYSYNNIETTLCGQDKNGTMPSRVDIDLTNVCNQDCFYCNSADFRRKFHVSGPSQLFYKLIDQLAGWKEKNPDHKGKLEEIVFTGGGEPTVHKDYHKIIEYAIDKGFMIQMITNGSKLSKLVKYLPEQKIKNIRWIGVDVDSGNAITYEKIRKSLTAKSLFEPVRESIKQATDKGYVCDIKSLIMKDNSTEDELKALFAFAKETNANKLHLRPFCDYEKKTTFEVTEETQDIMRKLSAEFEVPYSLNLGRQVPRTYKKCHQMFLYPIFAANGKIYVCCEGRGQDKFVLGNWYHDDIRDLWYGKKHFEIYNSIDVSLCPPCTPNKWNNEIQKLVDQISKN
jgi:molybdenum cofactor biosynthesis enzyme MoaA